VSLGVPSRDPTLHQSLAAHLASFAPSDGVPVPVVKPPSAACGPLVHQPHGRADDGVEDGRGGYTKFPEFVQAFTGPPRGIGYAVLRYFLGASSGVMEHLVPLRRTDPAPATGEITRLVTPASRKVVNNRS
jgi:hypothetical protein